MRKDMAKVVTEAPRRGHANPSSKWGRRLTKDEYNLDDHGASRGPTSRHRQYGWNAKEFSDVLGPLRGYLRKQVGRPWDKVWSEITHNLDSRSLDWAAHLRSHSWGSGAGRLDRGRRPSVPQAAMGCDRAGEWILRPPSESSSVLQAGTPMGVSRYGVSECASGSACLWHSVVDGSGATTLPRRRLARLGAPRGRLVHSHLPPRTRTAGSRDHSQRRT